MKQPSLCSIIAAVASLLFIGSEVRAQGDVPRFEIGGQFSLLSLDRPRSQIGDFVLQPGDFSGYGAESGFGARLTYNVTNHIALEAEGNFFPRQINDFGVPGGQIYQGQFGVKVGKRFKKVGLFIKIRPGFVRFTKVSQFTGFSELAISSHSHIETAEFRTGKATYFSADLGAVLEFYPSRRIVTRLDVGDTIIRYGIYREPAGIVCTLSTDVCPASLFERPAETRHNLQFSAGIGIRF